MRRLPFHSIIEAPWSVLRPELVEKSIPQLLPLTLPLDMHTDKFYVTVVDNLMIQMKSSMEDTLHERSGGEHDNPSSPDATTGKIKFADFKGLILKIRDIEIAISIVKYVADAFPCGVDKVLALKTAMHMAEKWHQKISTGAPDESGDNQVTLERASVALGRLRDFLARTETEHQLRSHNLIEFVELIPQWPELICQLYLKKSEKTLVNKDAVDLHAITNDIAKRHGLDIEKIRQYLLRTWLTQQLEVDTDEQESCLLSMRMQITNNANPKQETSLQMRVLYLLRYGAVEKNTKFLLEFAYQPSQKITTLTRIRALSVLLQLASPEEISRVQKYQEVRRILSNLLLIRLPYDRSYMQMLLYLADFEELKIQQTLKEFIGCDKDALARSLWVSHSDEPKVGIGSPYVHSPCPKETRSNLLVPLIVQVVELICNLCLDYRIHDLTLWENALGRLLHFRVYKYLLGVLEYVGSIPELAQMKGLPRLWNGVLLGWLRQAKENSPVDDMLTKPTFLPVFLLIQKCPFLSELDVDAFAGMFEEMFGGGRDNDGKLQRPERVVVAFSVLPACNRKMRERIRAVMSEITSDKVVRVLDSFTIKPQSASTSSTADGSVSGVFEYGLSKVSDTITFDVIDSHRAIFANDDLHRTYCHCFNFTWHPHNRQPFILSALYTRIDQLACYDALVGTRHLADLVLYLAQHDRLDRIVTATAKMRRWQDVKGLVGVYYRVRGTKRTLDQAEDGEEKDLVRRYVRQRGLEGQVVLPMEGLEDT
ncbi:rough deal protein C-terminal region-domain-containing protein [Jimgerdemannia flammicorona]|uniref:Rough deal protein C-terminal region-domain-containing protein n=1 Tax=Jimgerdemannia flammicorona TaxID=994334 RepID=A0A433QK88_9FUNG|nr:rough deal protein C-terminal region-domain-containing protein [Jimgerdemannia flammicorona]